MKKLVYCLSLVFCLSFCATVYAYDGIRSVHETKALRNNQRQMLARLHEIQELATTHQLSKEEKTD